MGDIDIPMGWRSATETINWATKKQPMMHGVLSEALLEGGELDEVTLPGSRLSVSLKGVREVLWNWKKLTPVQFAALPRREQDNIVRKLRLKLETEFRRQHPDKWKAVAARDDHKKMVTMEQERDRIFREVLVPWSRGPLKLEKPQASSLHHLLDYDQVHTDGTFAEGLLSDWNLQTFVVENDWARAAPPMVRGEEWILPFPLCSWEFRVSGVRVITFTDAESYNANPSLVGYPTLFSVYGAKGHWVMDDYVYAMGSDGVRGVPHQLASGSGQTIVEFRAVNEMIHREIRASCIMLDAEVCHKEKVCASAPLVQRAKQERRQPPRSYMVVRLLNRKTRTHSHRPRVAGPVNAKTPQRGHWRRGTWVHFDDQDSGQVQYVNDGGFVVSKTWRRWHFAGDPNNIIEREFRL